MKYYFAPMEGITGYVFRNAFHRNFIMGEQDLDFTFFSPFLVFSNKTIISNKELRDIAQENNSALKLIPQILTNRENEFYQMCDVIMEHGYQEVNLNFGCPSGTVVSKKRGAGFLLETDRLQAFLESAMEYSSKKNLALSIKTRIGFDDLEEWEDLLKIYNQYPLKEVIIHPRLREDYYKKPIHMESFLYAYENSKNPICYNGDLFRRGDVLALKESCPNLDCIMLGRGLLRNPWLLSEIMDTQGMNLVTDGKKLTLDPKKQFLAFHNDLLQSYSEVMSGTTPVLYKMKELWFYMIYLFPEQEKLYKKIKKSQSLSEYESIVQRICL